MRAIIEDFLIGFIFAQVSYLVIGLWSVPIGVISGILWTLGGRGYMGTKAWRRYGVPLAICLPFAFTGHCIGALISLVAQYGVHCVGYGEIDVNDTEGSWLGRHFGSYTRLVWWGLMVLALFPLIWIYDSNNYDNNLEADVALLRNSESNLQIHNNSITNN
jgi:hypothetical protein